MTAESAHSTQDVPTVGGLLRKSRRKCAMSQMELALASGISQKHLSFVETGRARPSRRLLLRLVGALSMPVAEADTILLAAGYAPLSGEPSAGSTERYTLLGNAQRVLRAHDPFPGVALDSQYNVVLSNSTASFLLSYLVTPELLDGKVNLVRVGLHPDGLATRIVDFRGWREDKLRFIRNVAEVSNDRELASLYNETSSYHSPGASSLRLTGAYRNGPAPASPPSLSLQAFGSRLNFTTAITVFGAASSEQNRLMLATYHPADSKTAETLRSLVGRPDR
ncbi:MmyB family transcriptional regulator [Streptomyces olivaceoviridis]|uniref:helix-turn-helix domain-containing protein n=1 Tax=Streptomyces olivaceoviridis TaxID=1921 RepID=UPI00227D8803|nr:helix-turn-helix domain-containing protein [Streptomyces olivaceoviridis]